MATDDEAGATTHHVPAAAVVPSRHFIHSRAHRFSVGGHDVEPNNTPVRER